MTAVLGVPGPDPSLSAEAADLWLSGRRAERPIEPRGSARPIEGVADDGFEAARRRLLAAIEAAQAAMVDAVDAADTYGALLPPGDAERYGLVDGGVLLAHLTVRVAGARYGATHRLVAHLRYFAGQRFLDERPDGLLVNVARPRERRGLAGRPP